MTLVDDSIQPEQPKPKCQGNWCSNDAFAYIEGNNVVVLLCEQCIAKVADAATILGIPWKVFDPKDGPLMPKDADTDMSYEKTPEGNLRLIRARRQIYNGGSFELNPYSEQAAVACCDCGLVHILDLHLLDYSRTVRVTLRRDNDLTEKWRNYSADRFREMDRGERGTAPVGSTEEGKGSGAQPGPSTVEEGEEGERGQAGGSAGGALAGPLEGGE